MNVYSCWYQGKFGYTCRFHTGKWMFVPELGQIDNITHRNLALDELTFKYASDKSFARLSEAKKSRANLLNLMKTMLFPRPQSRTIAGKLLTSY